MTEDLDTWENVAHDATHTWPEAESVPVTDNDPVLHRAAYFGDIAQLAMALEGIDDIDRKLFQSGSSPLYLAIHSDQAEAVQVLLNAGADTRKPRPSEYTCYDFNCTAIEAAAYYGSEESLIVLADHGIEISDEAFSEAVAGNHISCIRAILQRWQDGSREKSQIIAAMRNAIMRAAPLFCQGALEILLSTIPGFPDAKVEADRKALTWAMRAMLAHWDENEGCIAVYTRHNQRARPMLELLIAAGAEVDSRAFWACLHPTEVRVIRLLLDNGLNVHDRRGFDTWYAEEDENEALPLILSVVRVAEDDLSILEDFLANGASASTTDDDLNTPLHNVSHVSFARLLLKHGADINSKNKQGNTPLYAACAENRLVVARELIAHGADVRVITKDESWMPLMDRVVDRNDNSNLPAPSSRFRLPDFLISFGANVNAKAEDGDLLLHKAVRHHDFELLRYLSEHGADMNATVEGDTILHLHCSLHTSTWLDCALPVAMLRYIVDRGLDPNVRDCNGATALHGLLRDHEKPRWKPDLLNALLERGADLHAQDESRRIDGSHVKSPADLLDMSKWMFNDAGLLQLIPVSPRPLPPNPEPLRGPPPGWVQGGSRTWHPGPRRVSRSTWT